MKNWYLIAVTPPAETAEEIDQLRKEFAEKYACQRALKPPVHLTLSEPFEIRQELEPKLMRLLTGIGLHQMPFEQSLNGFGHFGKEVIYIKADQHEKLMSLKKEIRRHIRKRFGHKDRHSFKPHYTIAYRDLSEEMYTKAYEEYQHREFSASYLCETITLLRYDDYKLIPLQTFPLRGQETLRLF